MRQINYLVVHCTATPQNTTLESIKNYWRNVLKWKSNGYHFIIEANGKINNITPIESIANGVAGYNSNSIHISYIGGVDNKNNPVDNRTFAQKQSLIYQLQWLKRMFPKAKIQGHRDFPNVKKACPCFNAITEYEDILDIFG